MFCILSSWAKCCCALREVQINKSRLTQSLADTTEILQLWQSPLLTLQQYVSCDRVTCWHYSNASVVTQSLADTAAMLQLWHCHLLTPQQCFSCDTVSCWHYSNASVVTQSVFWHCSTASVVTFTCWHCNNASFVTELPADTAIMHRLWQSHLLTLQ